jgi:hypothetical protein
MDTTTDSPPLPTPPPLPPRSHLRDGSAYQLKLRAMRSDIERSTSTTISAPVSQGLLEEIDRELTDTQERLVSAILGGREVHEDAERSSWQTWEDDEAEPDMRRMGRTPNEMCNVKVFFMNGRGSEMSYENDRPEPLLIGARSATSSVYSQCRDQEWEKSIDEDVEVLVHVSTGQSSYDGATSSAAIPHASHHDDTRVPSSISSEEELDTKVEDWLARGSLLSPSLAFRHSRLHSKDVDRAFPARKPALSLFPPKSPSTGKLEYTPPNSPFARPICPLSPLGNGRDAYGNYISTNSPDYFTAQSPPTSPGLRPMSKGHNSSTSTSLRAIPEGQALSTTKGSSPVVHLRGGGWIKPFWKTTDTGEGSQAHVSIPRYRTSDVHGFARDVPVVHYAGREDGRAAPSVRSQLSVLRSGRDVRTSDRTHVIQSANADNVRYRGEHVTSSDRPKTHDFADTDVNSKSKARVEKLLDHYDRRFVPPSPMVPISAGTRPITARGLETTYPDYSKKTLQPIGHQRPLSDESWESQSSASTILSYETTLRAEKRWNRDNHLPPLRAPPPVPPKDLPPMPLNGSHDDEDGDSVYSDGSNQRPAPSIAMSATSANDPLRDLPGLQTSETYRDYAYAREVARIEVQRRRNAEADRRLQEDRRRQLQVQSQDPDRSTIVSTSVPGDSIFKMVQRQRLERLRGGQPMRPVIEQHRPYSPAPPSLHVSRYVHTPVNNRPVQQSQNLSIGQPSLALASIANVQTGRPRKKSIQKVASFAGKVSRFLLAAPSDPELKTYSRRYPLIEDGGEPGMGADRIGLTYVNVAPHEMIAPPPAMGWRERRRSKDKLRRSRQEKSRDSPIGMRAGNPRTGIFGKTKGKGKERAVEETQRTQTQARDFASRDTCRAELPNTPGVNTSAYGTRPTKAANLGCPRSGSAPQAQQPVQNETVAGPSEPRYQTPRVPGEILPHDEQLGYPAHWRLMEFYGHGDQARITGQWVDRVTRTVTDEHIPLRGGAGSEPSSLAAHHFLLTRGAFEEREETNGRGYGDIDALLMSSTHLGLDEATVEALAGAEANMRSSFSTDSTVEEMREKRRKKNKWRQEDNTRTLALAMSF